MANDIRKLWQETINMNIILVGNLEGDVTRCGNQTVGVWGLISTVGYMGRFC